MRNIGSATNRCIHLSRRKPIDATQKLELEKTSSRRVFRISVLHPRSFAKLFISISAEAECQESIFLYGRVDTARDRCGIRSRRNAVREALSYKFRHFPTSREGAHNFRSPYIGIEKNRRIVALFFSFNPGKLGLDLGHRRGNLSSAPPPRGIFSKGLENVLGNIGGNIFQYFDVERVKN